MENDELFPYKDKTLNKGVLKPQPISKDNSMSTVMFEHRTFKSEFERK